MDYFITGTDTGIGKTYVTSLLLKAFETIGINVQGIKAVQTGCKLIGDNMIAPDILSYLEASKTVKASAIECFKIPCSPHLAAHLENKKINPKSLIKKIKFLSEKADVNLIEGAGGLLVPLTDKWTVIDMIEALDCEIVLVVGNRIGCINHALLSIEAIKNRGLKLKAIVMNNLYGSQYGSQNEITEDEIIEDNIRIISKTAKEAFVKEVFVCRLEKNSNYRELLPLARFLLKKKNEKNLKEEEDILKFDREHIWHPYTSTIDPLLVYHAEETKGVHIKLKDGTQLIDGMSSWWCAIHGYRHPKLISALKNQADAMPHIMFGGFTHKPAVNLCKNLLSITSKSLNHVFLCDSGSVAVEVALKMALQYWYAVGKVEKKLIITPRGGYYGDTLGAMSVCDPVNGMHIKFEKILPKHIFVSRPLRRFNERLEKRDMDEIRSIIKKNRGEIAAFIIEPIVQGAGGMWMYSPEYLKEIRKLCNENKIILILDEIATGFGRTGKMFACEWAGIEPDIMCVGKALTGGVLSLAATMASKEIANGISKDGGCLMHGPTFMANPMVCNVADASINLLKSYNWQEKVFNIQKTMTEEMEKIKGLRGVADVRILGAIGVVEMKRPVNVAKIQKYFITRHNVNIRPFGKLIYIMPPFIISRDEIKILTGAIYHSINENQWE